MSEPKTTSPLAPVALYLVDILEIIVLIAGCLLGIIVLIGLLFFGYRFIPEGNPKLPNKGDEETPCENRKEVNCNEERKNKAENN